MHQVETWPFDQSPKTAAITTRQVLEGVSVVRVVIHYVDDHSWAFLCGGTNQDVDGRVIAMGTAISMDDSLLQIADLPGWRAERSARGGEWIRSPFNDA